ncbi:MAG TPA: hypothetical protein VJR92_13635 [Gemmatimonadaceae bacterium]|nr:hypothetical protein [Gemmatimonadaceae bacterium]
MRRLRAALGAVMCVWLAPYGSIAAQQTHVLIATGLGGEPQYSAAFMKAALALQETAKTKWSVAPASLIYLAEDPTKNPQINGKSTREEFTKAFLALAQRAAPGDLVLVFLLGHGSGEGSESRVNFPGPDPTAADFKAWVAGFAKQTVVFVNASSASGDFVKELAGTNRIIVTATRTALERNESVFANHFVQGFVSGEGDADKDGRTTVREAFDYAKREVAKAYESANKLLTEHAAISDTTLAAMVGFGGEAPSTDPRVISLIAERRDLEDQLNALKARKDAMDATEYERELERIATAIAEKTALIRAARGGK